MNSEQSFEQFEIEQEEAERAESGVLRIASGNQRSLSQAVDNSISVSSVVSC